MRMILSGVDFVILSGIDLRILARVHLMILSRVHLVVLSGVDLHVLAAEDGLSGRVGLDVLPTEDALRCCALSWFLGYLLTNLALGKIVAGGQDLVRFRAHYDPGTSLSTFRRGGVLQGRDLHAPAGRRFRPAHQEAAVVLLPGVIVVLPLRLEVAWRAKQNVEVGSGRW